MRTPILIAVLMGFTTASAAQDTEREGSETASVSDEITQSDGEEIYRAVCQGCHQPDGSGADGAGDYPALAGNPNLEYPEYSIALVLNGQRAMPPFGGLLDDEQVAAVVQFIQTHWENDAEVEATADLVAEARQ